MPDDSYQIHWTNIETANEGLGPKRFTLSEGNELVRELNLEYPEFIHQLVKSNDDKVAAIQISSAPPNSVQVPASPPSSTDTKGDV